MKLSDNFRAFPKCRVSHGELGIQPCSGMMCGMLISFTIHIYCRIYSFVKEKTVLFYQFVFSGEL